ncbi:MAG: class I adenylate-forming enzyme family protein [Candidatus Kapabacteria bacterium]|nr:class I adenylate-forming enzyme family protein [Candidatus Kapabacteria bacterium]
MRFNHATYMEKPWMEYVNEGGERTAWSYSAFIDVSRRCATHLSTRGVVRGDRVVIAGHNHPDTIIAYFACWLIGACAVPLNMTEDDQRIEYIVNNCNANIVLCRSEYRTRLDAAVGNSGLDIVDVDTDSGNSRYYAALRECEPLAWPDDETDMRWDDCMIVYTSGTTGAPKGVVLIQQNLFADGEDIARWHGITNDQKMMCVLPIHHVNGTIVTHVTPFIVGASVVLHRKFSVHRFFSSIKNKQVNVVSVVPTLLALLLEGKADSLDVQKNGFRHIICGAGPLTCELAERFESTYDIPIMHGYGLSETTCYSCFLPTDLTAEEHRSWMQDHGFPSIGVAIPSNEMAIHDDQGQAVTDGDRGEIVIRGANVMRGYDGNEKANSEAFAFGWFRSGDEGFRIADSQGRFFYFITGRIKELIIRGGVNLAPLEIDEVINRAPGVKAGICVGFENNMYGEEVGALIVPLDGTTDMASILAFCRANLPFHKCPKVVVVTNELPVTSTGKYQRNKVKHLFSEWKDVQFRK